MIMNDHDCCNNRCIWMNCWNQQKEDVPLLDAQQIVEEN